MNALRLMGILGATVAYFFIVISILVSPWFNFYDNALSDLGNAVTHAPSSWIFNLGLILSGLLEASFAILLSARQASFKYLLWSIPLVLAGGDLAMIGIFSENVGWMHLVVSVVFFLSMILTLLLYSFVSWPLGSPSIGMMALIFGVASAIVWFMKWPWHGVAIQEAVTSVMASIWLILVCIKNVK